MLEANKKMFEMFMGDASEELIRKVTIVLAVFGFSIHILLWALYETEKFSITGESSELVSSPLSALYTPFSILLAYEVYQLVRTIPESFSSSVGKQFEIATLLVVRDILKRLSEVESHKEWEISSDLGFLLVECTAFLALLFTSLTYFKISTKSEKNQFMTDDIGVFIEAKRGIANAVLLLFLVIAAYSFSGWVGSVLDGGGSVSRVIFFLDFFTLLILADILILLISYWFYTDFSNLARNTGFVLSTVIIRVAISSEGVSSMILFTLSGLLGLAILRIFTPNEQLNPLK